MKTKEETQTIEKFVESFFLKHQETLTKNYPGLAVRRLLQTFTDHLGVDAQAAMLLDESDAFLLRLLEGEPLEYILNESHFFTSKFYVNENVLIPRSETEILVEDALGLLKKKKYQSFADVCSGSGCIAISILTEHKGALEGHACDISPEAMEVLETNLFRHQNKISADKTLQTHIGDRFDPLPKKVDLIVTNPPYIDWDEGREGVHFQTDLREPKIALYLEGATYQEWFEDFFKSAYDKLNFGGAILMEGHEDKLQDLRAMAAKHFANVIVKQDYTGRDRFLHGFKEEFKEE